jgi:S-formylglutathione hydrolase FrmB
MKVFLTLILSVSIVAQSFAGSVDTILVHSAAMDKDIKCVVISPDAKPSADAHWSVVYLLHGHSGNYSQWITTAPQLTKEATTDNILFVCPDGGYDSWYFDSPIDPKVRYETFITKELIPYIDQHYPTRADNTHRAITGLSMGGHGALYLAIRHRDLFGAAGATSGGVDFTPFPENWGIKKDLGDYATHKDDWKNNTVLHAADDLANGQLKLIIDCGTSDFFLPVNRSLHQKLLEKKIDHDYIERPGGHNHDYWNNSIDYQVIFFWKYFNSTTSPKAL